MYKEVIQTEKDYINDLKIILDVSIIILCILIPIRLLRVIIMKCRLMTECLYVWEENVMLFLEILKQSSHFTMSNYNSVSLIYVECVKLYRVFLNQLELFETNPERIGICFIKHASYVAYLYCYCYVSI